MTHSPSRILWHGFSGVRAVVKRMIDQVKMEISSLNRPAVLLMTLLIGSLPLQAEELAFWSSAQLEQVKHQLALGTASPHTHLAYQRLLRQSDAALVKANPSVTDKGITPPSGSKHDYLSLSAYWWPDAGRPGGLPWLRRDGRVNPASKNNQSDGVRLAAFSASLQALAFSWYFSGDRRYADKAVSMTRTWFINADTRMYPNLNFAQGVPGIAPGRHDGVLDGRYFATRVIDALIILRHAPGWRAGDEQAVRQWMNDYLNWLQTSRLGRQEARAGNNHGSWYALQVSGIAWYLHQPQVIGRMTRQVQSSLAKQIAADGTQPQELARTRSFHYSGFNLEALTWLADLARRANAGDLWSYRAAGGQSLLVALDYMAPYSRQENRWPYASLDQVSARLIPLLSRADNALGAPRYAEWIRQASFDPPAETGDAKAVEAKAVDSARTARGAVSEAERDTWLLSLPAFQ